MLKKQIVSYVLAALLTIFWAANIARAAQADFDYPPTASLDEVQQWVEEAPKHHPRLLATRAELASLRDSTQQDPTRRMLASAVLSQAEELLQITPVTRTLEGRRLLDQSRRCVKRVLVLATAYHLSGDPRYVRRCEAEMRAAAAFTDWNPSHFLDVAEMTFAMAIGYDWLFDEMDAETREELRTAIIQKGVALPFETKHKGWVKARNNWGQVCHGGLTAGALAVMEDEPELAARTVHNAIHNVTYAMSAYAPHGSYPEGPGYWVYGTSYNVLLIGVLESALGTDFGLTRAPGFPETGGYLSLVTGPSGQFFNYADGGATRSPAAALSWFADRFERPDWLLGEHERLRASVARLRPRDSRTSSGRLLPLALLWMDSENRNTPIEMPLNWSSEGETPIAVHRSSWQDPERYLRGCEGRLAFGQPWPDGYWFFCP